MSVQSVRESSAASVGRVRESSSAFALALFLVFGGVQAAEPPAWQFSDIHGKRYEPFADSATKAIVLVFVSTDCPIANSYQPALARVTNDYGSRGVAIFLIHTDPDLSVDVARNHAETFQVKAPVALDPRQSIARRVEATTVPEAVVVGRDGSTVYRGRIDDSFAARDKKRPKPTTNDLRDALDDIIAGRPVRVRRTEAIGCVISYRPSK